MFERQLSPVAVVTHCTHLNGPEPVFRIAKKIE
jgi:hypothetical protein